MPAAGPSSWTVADVAEWLEKDLELPAGVVAAFKDNAIAGPGEPGGRVATAHRRSKRARADARTSSWLAGCPQSHPAYPACAGTQLQTC